MYAYPPQADNRIFKRPMTDAERGTVVKSFQGNQKVMMILAPIPMLLFVVIVFLTNAGDAFLLTVFFYLFAVVTMVLCVLIIAMSAYLFKMRSKTADVLAEGTAIEVRGVAVRNQAEKNAPSYAVGPITVTVKQEDSRLIPEGSQVSILCVPRLNIALSANGAELEHGTWVKCPPNLEAMASQQQGPAPQPSYQRQGVPQSFQQPAYPPQGASQAHQQQSPAPQAPPQQGVFCPRCNLRNQPGAQYCQSCQAQLPSR